MAAVGLDSRANDIQVDELGVAGVEEVGTVGASGLRVSAAIAAAQPRPCRPSKR